MNVYLILFIILAGVYGLLTLTAGTGQLKAKKIPVYLAAGMLLSGLLMLGSIFLYYVNPAWSISILVAGLVLMHFIAIQNGLHLHGKLNFRHHLIRLLLSIITVLVLVLAI